MITRKMWPGKTVRFALFDRPVLGERYAHFSLFSDTHGDADAISGVLAAVPCDLLLHLGDCTADCEEPRALFPGVTIWQVAGNDHRDTRSGIHYEDVFEAGGVRIFMTHGHRYHARSGPDMLCARAEAFGAALALYGHTHIAAAGRVGTSRT